MKRAVFAALALALCAGLAGCARVSAPAQSAPPETARQAVLPTPAAASPAPIAASPTPAALQTPSPAEDSLQQAAAPPEGLTAHYPWERVPLPAGAELITVWNKQNGKKYMEFTTIALSTTKMQALAYFKPLLEKGSTLYPLAQADYAPLEILDVYPDVTSQAWLYAAYEEGAAADIEVIEVGLFTLADKETVAAATVQVTYRAAP